MKAAIMRKRGRHGPYGFVVKIQTPVFSTEGTPCLIYNRSRSILCQAPFEGELVAMMGDRVKIFCRARIAGENLRILKRVPDQDW